MDGVGTTAIIAGILSASSAALGFIKGRKKTTAEIEKIQLENLDRVVNFYKNTFEELEKQLKNVSKKCQDLSDEISVLRKENKGLKNEIHELHEKLKSIER